MSALPMSDHCIVCGQANPYGMHVQFKRETNGVIATVKPPTHFQGFDGVLHGGAVSGLLDDAMWWAVYAAREAITMTADLQVRYREPVPVETELTVKAELVGERPGRLYKTRAQILDSRGKVLAEAEAKFMPAPPALAARLRREEPGQD